MGKRKFDESPEGGDTIFCIAAFGALGTHLSFTPGCTGGHHCYDPPDLAFQGIIKRIPKEKAKLNLYGTKEIVHLWSTPDTS